MAQEKLTGVKVVIKGYVKENVYSRISLKGVRVCEDARNEIKIHQALSERPHRNLLQILGVAHDDIKIFVVLEFCEDGELFSFGTLTQICAHFQAACGSSISIMTKFSFSFSLRLCNMLHSTIKFNLTQ
jgi:hypothetical protein